MNFNSYCNNSVNGGKGEGMKEMKRELHFLRKSDRKLKCPNGLSLRKPEGFEAISSYICRIAEFIPNLLEIASSGKKTCPPRNDT